MDKPSEPFAGTVRFVPCRRLGAGSFGVVYEVEDRLHGSRVALKVLHRAQPHALYLFKREFRTLADLAHPNLVVFHELFANEDLWFFTMELVDGKDFFDALCGRSEPTQKAARSPASTVADSQDTPGSDESMESSLVHSSTKDTTVGPVITAGSHAAPPRPDEPARAIFQVDERRLRGAFLQLYEGVQALHDARILHRDIKPSNVLITGDDRVVVLDFGLALPFSPRRDGYRRPSGIAGTPAYMAPEQWIGKPESEASDWYSVGVMLYEALTRRRPFIGETSDMLEAKAHLDPTPPSSLVLGVPADLEALCLDLLKRDARARPGRAEIRERLLGGGEKAGARRPTPAPAAPELVGRAREVSVLLEAFREAAAGRLAIARVHGISGIGKTALVRHFLEVIERDHDAIVFRGRCYEREFVPFKAFDGAVDSLHRHLCELPRDEVAALLPEGMDALARIFPVLRGVIAAPLPIHDGPASGPIPRAPQAPEPPLGPEPLDPQLLQRRAFQALKALLGRMAARRPVVLCLDDVQWGDIDSARLLLELISAPDASPLLLLVCYRSDEAQGTPFLEELSGSLTARLLRFMEVDLPLLPLPEEDARALSSRRLADAPENLSPWVELIAREADGNPLFVEALVEHVRSGCAGWPAEGLRLTLGEVIRARLERLPEAPRRLLELASVAGRPLRERIAVPAAELGPGYQTALAFLRSSNLLRTRAVRERPGLEVVHDRIRESVVASLDAGARAARHRALALAFEAEPEPEPEATAIHFHGAGELHKAARYATTAADHAARALAFARAAELYGFALDWGRGGPEGSPAARRSLEIRRANALANAGRGAEAAPLYLSCARDGAPAEALELRRRAGEQYLLSGRIDEATKILIPVLREVGQRFPSSLASTIVGTAARFARLLLRGFDLRERREAEIPKEQLDRIDVCWSISQGLSDVDPLRAFYFQLRFVHSALDAGEPVRAARAMAAFGMLLWGFRRPWFAARGSALLTRAEAMAERLDDPMLSAVVAICTSTLPLAEGRWSAALARADRGIRLIEERCVGAHHLHNLARGMALLAVEALGAVRKLEARASEWLREASERGDLFGRTSAALTLASALIAAGDVDGARQAARDAVGAWSRSGFYVQHAYLMRLEASADLYEGRSAAARARVREAWPEIRRSQILRVSFARFDMLLLRARAALAAAAAGAVGRAIVDEAEADARRLEGERRSDARPTAALLLAAAARLRGDQAAAAAHAERAIVDFEAAEMVLHAACSRRARGALAGGEDGRAAMEAADSVMRARGVSQPSQWFALHAPGFETPAQGRG